MRGGGGWSAAHVVPEAVAGRDEALDHAVEGIATCVGARVLLQHVVDAVVTRAVVLRHVAELARAAELADDGLELPGLFDRTQRVLPAHRLDAPVERGAVRRAAVGLGLLHLVDEAGEVGLGRLGDAGAGLHEPLERALREVLPERVEPLGIEAVELRGLGGLVVAGVDHPRSPANDAVLVPVAVEDAELHERQVHVVPDDREVSLELGRASVDHAPPAPTHEDPAPILFEERVAERRRRRLASPDRVAGEVTAREPEVVRRELGRLVDVAVELARPLDEQAGVAHAARHGLGCVCAADGEELRTVCPAEAPVGGQQAGVELGGAPGLVGGVAHREQVECVVHRVPPTLGGAGFGRPPVAERVRGGDEAAAVLVADEGLGHDVTP